MKKINNFLKKHRYTLGFVFLLISFSLFMMLLFTKESDYFWHIKAGEYMFKNNLILKKDIFSWFMNGQYWMSHEWAFDYLIYFLSYLFEDWHLFIYPFICVSSLLIILFFTNKKNYLKNILFSLVWIIMFLIFCVYIQSRPHLISFLFLTLTVWILYDLFNNEESKKIYFLPLITLFWANFHGGSSNLSYLFCLVFLVIGLFKFNFGKIEAKRITKKQLYKYLVFMFVCIGVICINPHGIKMLVYPYSNITDTVMINFITEWQPTVLGKFSHYPYFILIVFCLFMMIFSKEKIKFIDFVLFGISIILGLKSIRFWGYTYLIMTYVIFNYVPDRKIDKGTTRILFLIGAIFLGIFITNLEALRLEYSNKVLSEELIEVIKNENPKKLYNMYDYGGELIYNDIRVFVDGRADLYSRTNLLDYKNISMLQGDYIALIEKYNFDYYLVTKKYPINTYLCYSSDYELIYSENNIMLYKKKIQFD